MILNLSKRRVARLFLVVVCLLPGLIACRLRTSEQPSIAISAPENRIQVRLGERVLVQSTATDDHIVIKTELWVDDRLYQVDRPGRADDVTSFDVIQIWDASVVGTHSLMVKAHDEEGQVSLPASVIVEVLPALPAPTPVPTRAPVVEVDPNCEPSARFVEDVTVPDDSLYNAETSFTKTWRLRNDGTCPWEPGTEWVFISGNILNARSPMTVERADPDRIVDISVDMTAPSSPGTFTSYWRLRRPSGEFFGDQAYVRIIVP